jgi:hypothetical protein
MYCIAEVNIFSAIGLSCDRELGRLLQALCWFEKYVEVHHPPRDFLL